MPDGTPASPAAPPLAPATTAYDPTQIEAKWYRYWEEGGFFTASAERVRSGEKAPHVIMMPPPNVTGRLHMGHALQDAVQDTLTRLRRLQGYEALWLPGIDHAGIATQNVVERELKDATGETRHHLGRDAFVDKVWDWKNEYGDIILQQKRRLGDSCDWSRERFTMDERYARAVQLVFVQLFEQGLIYRGNYLVNWDPENQTAISDEEVDNVERDGHLWHVRYPLADGSGSVTIATTRPETMLGDTGVAVHPEDERYTHLVGMTVRLPLLDREIPIVADDYVKMDFGAGALKVTPAHDKNDFEIGRRHSLEVLNVMNPDATINENGGPYAGLDRFEARKKIVADLEAQGLLVRVEDVKNTVPISSRSKAVIEPLISRQWFVKMAPLAERALEVVRDGTVTFHPERWANEYFRWLENIRDWTISRQLWWGHRIPVWYYLDEHGEIDEARGFVVALDQPYEDMVQDEDVLDTWFSSWLWPFATLGWPEDTEDLKAFYPGTVLVSGYDILFFWIARMIMAGLHFTGEVPYRDVYITGMIKDKYGRWMSKSLGNGIDPLDMIDQYGADAVRFSLNVLCTPGQDIKLDPAKFEMGRNFANKIWNAFNVFGRFMEDGRDYRRQRTFDELELVERWMVTRLNETIRDVDEAVSRYRLNEAALLIYDLFWRDYCDWYLELIKPERGADGGPSGMDEETLALAVELYEKMVQLLHPFMPFITEELWWRLRPREAGEACIVSAWPTATETEVDTEAAQTFALLQELVTGVRSVRSQYNVAPSKGIAATFNLASGELVATIRRHGNYFARLAGVADLVVGTGLEKPAASAAVVVGGHEVFVPLAGMIDLSEERARLEKEIMQKKKFLASVDGKLRNPQFTSRAPAEVVQREQQKAQDARAELEKLHANLADLGA
jgi:valyl-tRNA synthetase